MSLEGTIRDLGLQEIGQLLSLGRKSGILRVESVLRGTRAWVQFVDGAIVDAGTDEAPPPGTATSAASSGARVEIEEAALDVLAWRDGHFAFTPLDAKAGSASRVRIPTDAMLVESANREDAWNALRDRVASADAVPGFVDEEPHALPLLKLEPQEWEILTRVDGERSVRTLAGLMKRTVLEIASVVHGLIGRGLLVIAESQRRGLASLDAAPVPGVDDIRDDEHGLWIPAVSELPAYAANGDVDDVVFDPLRAGLLAPDGSPRVAATMSVARGTDISPQVVSVTLPAMREVALEGVNPSSNETADVGASVVDAASGDWLREGDAAARRGDFQHALACWSHWLRTTQPNAHADRVQEAISLTARLQALLYPMA